MSISDKLNPSLRTLPVYQPGRPIEDVARELGLKPDEIIKVASNENPLGPSPKAVEAMQAAIGQSHLYPDGNAFYLKNKLASKLDVETSNLILGNGSNEIIEFVSHALLRPEDEIVVSQYCFAIYPLIAMMMGAKVSGRCGGDLAPLSISGNKLRGAVIGTPVASAQIKSAILLAALNAEGSTTVIEPARSRDHSERMLKAFGANLEVGGEMGRHITVSPGKDLKGQSIIVPGDISSAAFWLVAGSIIPGSELTIENVGLNPTRTGILDVLEAMEANINVINKRDVAGEPVGDIEVFYKENLKPFKIDGEIMPRLVDEIPILSVGACFCNGISQIKGASELRVKETDRLAVMARQLKRMGASVDEHQDGLTIYGGKSLEGCELDSEDDHRIAMSLAIASIMANSNSTLRRSEAAAISYPDFWSDLKRLQQKN